MIVVAQLAGASFGSAIVAEPPLRLSASGSRVPLRAWRYYVRVVGVKDVRPSG